MADDTVVLSTPKLTDRVKAAFQGWFNPGVPITPVAPPGTPVRSLDFNLSTNLDWNPRKGEPIDYRQLRFLAENCTLMRVIIERMKDRICSKSWHLRLKPEPGEALAQTKDRSNNDPRVKQITSFLERPDGIQSWKKWLRMVLEDEIVIDNACLSIERNRGDKILCLTPIDGATISPLVDITGRRPKYPLPAYQQIIKGMAAIDLTDKDLVRMLRNPRAHKMHGFSPVEQTVRLMLTMIYRTLMQQNFYDESNVPAAFLPMPEDMSTDEALRMMKELNAALSGNIADRQKIWPIPKGSGTVQFVKQEDQFQKFDEWAARVFCFAIGETATTLVSQNNRATAQQSDDTREEFGEQPRLEWIKDELDTIIQSPLYFNAPDVELMWDEVADTDALKQAQVDQIYVTIGKVTPDELRARDGQAPLTPEDRQKYWPSGPKTLDSQGKPIDPKNPPPAEDEDESDDEPPPKPGKKKAKPTSKAAAVKKKSLVIDPAFIGPERAKAMQHATDYLTGFFADQATHFAEVIPEAYGKIGKAEEGEEQKEELFKIIELKAWEQIAEDIMPDLDATAREAVASSLAVMEIASSNDLFSLADTFCTEYAMDRGAQLVGMKWVNGKLVNNPNAKWAITDTTREGLQADIVYALENNLSPDELKQRILDSTNFSPARAETIARSETAMAQTAATVHTGEMFGANGKSIQMSNDHDKDDECDDAEEEGIVPLDFEYSDGEKHVPLHPNCCCVELLHFIDETDEANP